ncbi:MAG TPA: hypothetical protein DCW90_22350 [Lachnospiraceae bacterium]|nr:hypothetical protein [Lachnospiraceae bacterium]
MTSFENTKSSITGSALGKALSMTSSTSWSDVVTKIKGVVNRGTLNWSGSNTTYSVSAGYYSGGTLDSRTSYNNGYNSGRTQGRNDVKNSPNSYSLYTKSQYDTNYNNGYNNGVSAGKSAFSYTQISGASGGAQEYNSDTITVPSGKTIMWLVVSISNPNLQGYTAAYLNGSKQTWTLNMNKSNAHLFVLKANVSGGQRLYIHGKRAASGTGSDMQGIALFA